MEEVMECQRTYWRVVARTLGRGEVERSKGAHEKSMGLVLVLLPWLVVCKARVC